MLRHTKRQVINQSFNLQHVLFCHVCKRSCLIRSQLPCVTGATEICDLIATPLEVLTPSSVGLSPSLVSILSTNTIITIEIVSK